MQRTCTRPLLAVRGVADMANRGMETDKRGDHD